MECMARIKPETMIPVTKGNIALILKQYGITDFTFTHMQMGIVNTALHVQTKDKEFVLKIYQYNRKSVYAIQDEVAFQNFLRDKHIPIPEIYPTREENKVCEVQIDNRQWQAILMEFMPGENNAEYSDELIRQLAEIQATIHLLGMEYAKGKTHKATLPSLQNGYAQKVMGMVGNNVLKQKFLTEVHEFEVHFPEGVPWGYVHLDIDLGGNVLVLNNRISAILDFDDLIFAPLIACLGNTLWHILYASGSWEKVGQYIIEYEKVRPLNGKEKKFLLQVMKYRNFLMGCLYIELGKDGEDYQKILRLQKEIDEKITEAWL